MSLPFKRLICILLVASFCCAPSWGAKKRRSRRRNQKPITHPVVLWARTLSETTDSDQKKVAAFKLSQYSQTIYQDSVIQTLLGCLKESDVQIKILCAKALGNAGNKSKKPSLRKTLLETYQSDPSLQETLVRTFIKQEDSSKEVQDLFLRSLQETSEVHLSLALLNYFYGFGEGVSMEPFITLFNKSSNDRIRRWSAKVLSENGSGESGVVELLAKCAETQDTPLALTCLAGLQTQSKKDSDRTWAALEKTLESNDPDMLIASLDVINGLPPRVNSPLSKRLIELASNNEDGELVDKAVLALGVCGDQSEKLVATVRGLLVSESTSESTKIHAALVLGTQSGLYSEQSLESLKACQKKGGSQSLKTACELGARELTALVKKAKP